MGWLGMEVLSKVLRCSVLREIYKREVSSCFGLKLGTVLEKTLG